MIKAIKEMINSKQALQEAADIILEDARGNLDDLIVLGEESEDLGDDGVGMESEDPETPDEDEEGENDNLMDQPVDGTDNTPAEPTPPEPVSEPSSGDDLMSAPADEPPMPLPGDDLPAATGTASGDPIDDLMNITVDLRSNTISDTLPVPPANASEVIPEEDGEDLMSQKVDSGFGESAAMVLTADKLKGYHIEDIPYLIYTTSCRKKGKDPVSKDEFNSSSEFKKLKSSVYSSIADFIRSEKFTVVRESQDVVIFDYDEIKENTTSDTILEMSIIDIPYDIYVTKCMYEGKDITSREQFNESSLGEFQGDIINRFGKYLEAISLGDDESGDDPTASDDAAARSSDSGETPPDETSDTGENEVTSAVRDKVAEADGESGTDDFMGDDSSKDKELYNQLTTMSKNLEDLKKKLVNNMQ